MLRPLQVTTVLPGCQSVFRRLLQSLRTRCVTFGCQSVFIGLLQSLRSALCYIWLSVSVYRAVTVITVGVVLHFGSPPPRVLTLSVLPFIDTE